MKFADKEIAGKVIKRLYPKSKNISFIEHGYDNLVVLVDELYALRFPKYKGAYVRDQYEKQILLELSSFDEIAVPKFLGEGQNPPYLITNFLFGKHLSSEEIENLSKDRQKGIGETLAGFAYAVHSLLSVRKTRDLRNKLGFGKLKEEVPWEVYFEKVLDKSRLPIQEQDKIAKNYYRKWRSLIFTTPTVVIHDDLHLENLLFEDGELTGVLDFGETNTGTPEQEFRQFYRINETALNAAVDMYEQLSGYKLNREAIKIWAIIQELAAYSEKLQNNKTDHPSYSRAVSNLNKWFPQINWG